MEMASHMVLFKKVAATVKVPFLARQDRFMGQPITAHEPVAQ